MVDFLQDTTSSPNQLEVQKPLRLPYSPHNLRKTRKHRKFSQVELARRAGVNRMTVQACEGPKANPTYQVLLGLGQALNIVWSADWQSDAQADSHSF